MEKIETPDGVIEIPDNIDPIKRSELAGAVKRLYNIDINKVSLLDQVVDAPKSIARSVLSTTASVPQGLVGLFDIGNDSELYKGLTGYRDFLREDSIFASDPKLRDKYSTKLAEGFGSFVPFLGAGLAGRALAAKGVVGPVTGTFGLPAALAVPTGISEQADRQAIAREMGEEVGVGAEIASELIGGVIGLTEIFPVTAFLKKVPKSALRNPELKSKLETLAKDFGTGFLQEGSQELFASLAQDLTARGLYSDSLPIGESAFDEFTIGGIVGGTAKAVINSLGRKQGITKEYAEEKARREQKNKKELLQTKKFEMGIAQGEVEEVQNIPPVVKPELVTPEVTIPEPDLEVVSLPNNTFSVVDNNNTTQPIVANFNSEAEALTNKDKLMTDFNNTKLKTELENQLYIQGNINSGTAFEIGQSLLDPIATTVTPNDVMAAKNKISDKAKTKFLNENKNPLTLTEAKKNLNKTEFNNLTQALAAAQFKANEDNGQPPITAGKNKIDVSPKYIKELAASKNIDKFSFNTPAVAHALEIYTGDNNFNSMSRGQKELLVSRLHAIPKFNQKREFPDFRPRDYSAKDTADFISNIGKTPFTLKDTQTYFDGDKQKASSFISDLKSSGRVDYLKDEGAYQVKDNFEFEIARRAESFGQTPQEFGETLKQEGKLSEEAINQLIAEETVRQEKVLPPAEIEPKIFNLAEAVEIGRTNKFAKEIRKQLDKFGLKETGIIVSDDILSSTALTELDGTGRIRFNPSETRGAEGEYDKQTDIIFLSVNAVNPDGNATDLEIQQRLNSILNHEIIHALRYKDLITESEYNYLRKLVKSRKVSKTYDENFTGKTFYERSIAINKETIESRRRQGINISKEFEEEFYVEEAIAEMYRAKDIAADIPPKAQGIYNKIVNFFKGLGQAMRLSGYKNLANVFQDIEQGIVGARTRGEIRTTRELDRGAPITSLPPDLQAEKDSRDRAAAQAKQPVEETEQGAVIETRQTPKELSRLEPSIPTRPTPPPPPPPDPVPNEPLVKPEEPVIESNPVPNTIYDSEKRTAEEKKAEETLIADGLAQVGVISKDQAERIKKNQGVRTKGDTIKMLQWLIKNSPSQDYRILASKSLETLNKLKKFGVELPFSITSVQAQGQVRYRFTSNLADNMSDFMLATKILEMRINPKTGLNFETILHEVLHSSSMLQLNLSQVLEEQNAAAKKAGFRKLDEQKKVPVQILSTKTVLAFRNLNTQRERVIDYIKNQKLILAEDVLNFNKNAKTDERYYRKDLNNNPILKELAFAIYEKETEGNTRRLTLWDETYIDYILQGKQSTRTKGVNDSSEFITFGFTNRAFQSFLENIPFNDKSKKTVWNKFVESIREILNLPAKLDTEFAAFLNNAADIFYDPTVSETKLRAPPSDIPTFSRGELNRKEIENQIFEAEDTIYRLEREEFLESDTMTRGSLNRLQGKIRQQQRNLEFYKSQLANLPKEVRTPVQLNLLPNPNDEDLPSFARMKGSKDVYDDSTNSFGDRLKARKYFMYALQPNRETWLGRLYPFYKNKIETETTNKGETFNKTKRQEDLSKRLYKTDTPNKDETINNIVSEAREISSVRDFVSSFAKYINASRVGDARKTVNEDGSLDLKSVPLKTKDFAFIEAIENNPTIKGHMNWFLSQFTNKRGNLILYRSLNNPKGFKLKNAQNPFDDFSSTSLIREDMKYISVPTRPIPLGANAQAVIDTARAELSPVKLDEMMGSQILNQDKVKERENLQQLIKDVTEIAALPQTIYRYEVPLDRVKVYVPYVKSLLEDASGRYGNLTEIFYNNSLEASGGYTPSISRPEKNDFDDDSEYEDALYEYENQVEREKAYDADREFGGAAEAAKEEIEVIADLSGLQPQLEYMPEQEIEGETFNSSLIKFDPDIPMFSKGTRYATDNNTSENIKLIEAVKTAEEEAKSQPRGGIPRYNTNASDIALQAAIEFDNDPSMKAPDDIPLWSKPSLDSVDQDIKEGVDRTGGAVNPQQSFGARLIDVAKDPIVNIKYFFRNFRQSYVDKLDKIDKKLIEATLKSEEVRQANNTADTATMAALRLTDRARGLFQSMLTTGTITDKIEGISALSNVIKGKDGGLIEILAPLYSNPDVDQESIFKFYASLKRTEQFLEDGRKVKSPITDADLALINKIETQYSDVKNTFEAYQRWNNELITFAENKGLLGKFKSNNQIIEELEKEELIDKTIAADLKKLSQANEGRSLPEIVELGKQNGIDTRGQGQIWREHSSYYPFYREMVDDSEIAAPTIGGGALPNNPLSIALEGSEDVLNVNPLEAISRNSLSILTASLKNDGLAKLVRDLATIGEAKEITPKQAGKLNSIFVFEDGIKRHYEVDPEIINALQSVGGTYSGGIEKVLAMPAGFLRDTVTRDPGFVIVNVLRDTLSSMVTSGANFIPVIDSFKNLGRSMEDLEKFGVLGGYDFANDEGSIKQYITRTMRREGLAPDNGMSAEKAFFKLWDGLGGLTTKSDGATRLAVYESVYKKLKAEGYNEAQAQSEAAYQSLEIINFGRRGLDPMFKVITAAIPFFNARIQGLDVLYRSVTGKYSAVEKLQSGETQADVKSRIQKKVALNASILAGITLGYYLLTHDSEEYKNLKREVRDDNWIIPLAHNHALKIPVPFEVGFLFKTIPERLFDMTLGDNAFTQASADEALTSFTRGLGTSLNLPIIGGDIGIQAIKPLQEAIINRNSFTGQDIIPYYQLKREPGYQARETTNVLAKGIGEALNISPAKIEHVMRGYTGTLGGYVIALSDTIARGVTGEPLLPNNANLFKQLPVVNRLILERDKSGGLQQQFYELRSEVDRFVSTINALKKQKRFDELSAYRSNNQGVTNIKGQVRAMEKYLDNWRKRRTALFQNKNLSVLEKSERLREMELERDKRLAFVPELRKRAEIPVFNLGL